MSNEGWKCPNCGKAHAPTVLTCPNDPAYIPGYPIAPQPMPLYPVYPYQSPMVSPFIATCGDPPGSVGFGAVIGSAHQ